MSHGYNTEICLLFFIFTIALVRNALSVATQRCRPPSHKFSMCEFMANEEFQRIEFDFISSVINNLSVQYDFSSNNKYSFHRFDKSRNEWEHEHSEQTNVDSNKFNGLAQLVNSFSAKQMKYVCVGAYKYHIIRVYRTNSPNIQHILNVHHQYPHLSLSLSHSQSVCFLQMK